MIYHLRGSEKMGSVLALVLLCGGLSAYCQQFGGDPPSYSIQSPPLPVDQVAKKLEERDAERSAALYQFSGRRIYRMQYRGFFSDRDAQMVVDVTYHAPNVKQFKVVSQSGSPFVMDHLFKKLMESEQEFVRNDKRQTALNTENYDFTFAGYEQAPDGAVYVLNLRPKKRNKFLYRGKIWVDAKDFAVVRIQAEPAQSPSIWIKKTEIEHSYMKVGDFWLPSADHTESEIRFGGEAVLSIDYRDYKIIQAAPVPGKERARADSH
jgi:outer membrane lipoprotein-sorting protein